MLKHLLRRKKPERAQRVAPLAEWLEPRLLFSADAAGLLGLGAVPLPPAQERSLDDSFEYAPSGEDAQVVSKLSANKAAPVLTGGVNPITHLEDLPGNGTRVADLIAGHGADPAAGIAVTAVPNNLPGAWHYSLDGGASWQVLTGTNSNALLLGPEARVRFQADDTNPNGSIAGFTLRAWDGSTGVEGGTANPGAGGGSSAFSTTAATVSLTVTPVNDRPGRYVIVNSTAVPVAAPVPVTVNEGTAGSVSLGLGSMSYIGGSSFDEYNSPLTYTVTHLPPTSMGTVVTSTGVRVNLATYTLQDIEGMRFRPATGTTAAQSGVDLLQWTVRDDGGTLNGGIDTLVDQVEIRVQNVAPVLTSTANFTPILEDQVVNNGNLVSELVGSGRITNPPTGLYGIAVTWADTSNGSWQYSLNNGGTWLALGAPSDAASVLLAGDTQTRLRFLPTQNYNGAASIHLRAWDQSSGVNGGTADTSARGSAAAFSTAELTASISVTWVNDAPALLPYTGTPTATNLPGLQVLDGTPATSLGLGGRAYGPGATDEAGQTLLLTVTQLPGAIGRVLLADATPVVLGGTYSQADIQGMTFESAGLNIFGTGSFTFSIRDNGGVANGGSDTLLQTVQVIVNRAPVLTGANSPLMVYEDFDPSGSTPQGNPPPWASPAQRQGLLVSQIIDGHIVDSAGSLAGIAITGLAGGGDWQYSVNGGTNWIAIGAVSDTSSLQLASDATLTRVRFLPHTNFNSAIAPATITFRAWDRTTGSNGSYADTTWNGDASAFSAQAQVSVVTVVPVNDEPVATGTLAPVAVIEGGQPVSLGIGSMVYTAGPASATDELALQTLSFRVTAVPSQANFGHVLLADGLTIVNSGSTYTWAEIQGMVFRARPGVQPGTANFSFNVLDDAGTDNNGDNRLGQTLTIRIVNQAPVLTGANPMAAVAEDTTGGTGTLVSDLVAGHISDITLRTGIAVTSADNANGSWQYTTDNGATWLALGAPTSTTARLLAADLNTRLRFTPNGDWTGSASLGFVAWDTSSGTAGGTADASTGGGTSAFSLLGAVTTVAVTPVNDAPVGGTTGPLTVAEDSGSASLGLGSIAYGPGGGADEAGQALRYFVTELPTGLGGITLFDGTPVALGETTLADLQAMRFVAGANANGGGWFRFEVRDDAGGSDTLAQAVAITVTPVNDAPAALAGAVVADLTVAEDSGSTSLGLGSVGYGPGPADEAAQGLTYNVTALPPAALGSFLLADGTAVAAGPYSLDALRGMRFVATPQATGSATFTFTVTDDGGTAGGGTDTLSQSILITVTPVADAPVAVADSVALAEGGSVAGNVLANDTDADLPADTLIVTLLAGPAHGTLVLNADGSFSYAHDGSETAGDSFSYRVTDATGLQSDATVSITIAPVNDNAPVAQPGTRVVVMGGTVAGAVSVSDADLPNDTLTITLVTGPAHGSLSFAASGTFSYTHDGSLNLADSFVYAVTDAVGATRQATVSITVRPLDIAPVALPGLFVVVEGASVSGSVTFTDADLPSDTLTLTVVTQPARGVLVMQPDGSFTYTHDGSETLLDSFVYEVADAAGATSQALVTLVVTPANDPPQAQAGSATLPEGGTFDGAVVFSDRDPGDTLALRVVTGPAHGTLVLDADGSFRYVHDGSENFSDVFTWEVRDAAGATSQASFTLTVTPVVDNAPVAQAGSATVAEGGTVTGTVSFSDADVRGDSLVVTLVGSPAHGSVALNASGGYSYVHDGGEAPLDAFTFRVTDAAGASSEATVTLAITPVNDNAPVAQAGSTSVDEGGTVTGTVGCSDADAPDDTLTIALVSGTGHGLLTLAANGTYSYTHDGSENFADAFTWSVTDATGATRQASMTITVRPVSDNAPVAASGTASVVEGGTATGIVTAADFDLPNDTLSYVLVGLPAHGNVVLDANGSWAYTHDDSENFADAFTYEVTDLGGATSRGTISINVTPANDNPPVALDGSVTLDEGATFASTVSFSDADVGDSATVRLVTGPAHGVLTLLADGRYSYAHDGSENFADAFVYEVRDASGASSQATVGITVTPVNDNAPVAQGGTRQGSEGGTIDGTVVFSDADGANDSLTLAVTGQPVHGELTLNADGSFRYVHDGSESLSDAFTWRVTDAAGATSQATITLSLTPVNDNLPQPQASSVTVLEGASVDGAVTILDADLPADTLSLSLVAGPVHGMLDLRADGSFRYTHDGSENPADSFEYEVSDAAGHVVRGTVGLVVTPVNDNPPQAQPDTGTVLEGGTLAGTLVVTDIDLPNDAFTYAVVGAPAHGSVTIDANGGWRYVHDSSENFSDSFSYEVTDGGGATSQATVTIAITPQNDNTPVAQGGSVTVTEGGTLDGSVAFSDADAPNDTLTLAVVTDPTRGTLVLNADGSFRYVHDGSESLADAFTYSVTDASGATRQATITIGVTAVNDNVPVAPDSTRTVAEGATLLSNVGVTDADLPADTLVVTLVGGPAHGLLTLATDGGYSYTHDGSENFADAFSYAVADASGATRTGTVTLNVTAVNDNTPVAQDGSQTVLEGGTVVAAVVISDADMPRDSLAVSLVSGPAHGVLMLDADGSYSYRHDGSENFADSFVYEVSDLFGHTSEATVTLAVTPQNDNAPQAQAGSATVDEGGTVGGFVTAADADLPNDALDFTLVAGPAHGLLTLNTDGSYSYRHDGSENFADAFTYAVTDAAGASSQATVTLTVRPVNDNAPVALAGSGNVDEGGRIDASVTASDADLPNDSLRYVLLGGPAHGTLAFNSDGSYSYTHDGSENFSDAFTFRVEDATGAGSEASVALAIRAVNEPPVAGDGSAGVDEGALVTGVVPVSDPDTGEVLAVTLVSGPAHGTLSLGTDGRWSYRHDGSENFADAFTYAVTDAAGGSSQATITLSVNPVNDNAPVAQAGTNAVDEGGSVAGRVVFSDADAPRDTLMVTLVSGPAHGVLALAADGSYSYTHDGSESTADAFTYAVTDAAGASSQATVTLTVRPVNDNAPAAQGAAVAVGEGATVAGTVPVSDLDLPNDTLGVTLVQGPAHGVLTLNADGSYSYRHDGSENLADAFSYRVTDAAGATADGTVRLVVGPVNDNAPVAQDAGATVQEGGIVTGTLTAADADLPNDSLGFTVVAGPAHGTLTLNTDGSYSYRHDGSENFADVFTFRVTDAAGASSEGTVTLTVRPVNDSVPTAQDDAAMLDEGGTATGTVVVGDADLPADALVITLVNGPAHGQLVLDADGAWSYTHDGSENFTDAFTYAVTDAAGASSQASVRLTVRPLNDNAPVAQGSAASLDEGGSVTGTFAFADADLPNDALRFALLAAPAHGSVTLGADGSWRYTHDGSENFADAFTWSVTDANGESRAATVTLTVRPVNDNAPVAQAGTATVAEGTVVDGTLLASDADRPNDTLVFSVVTGPAHGSLTLGSDGSWRYTHDGSETLSDAFTYAVTDAAGATRQASVSVTVTPVNDRAPVAQAASAVVAEGGVVGSFLVLDDADLPNDALSVTLVTGPAHGQLVLGAEGAWRYTHDGSETLADAFTYAVTDAAGATSQATVTIAVTPVNDSAPVAAAGSATVAEGGTVAGTLTLADADLPADTLTVTLVNGPAHGVLALASDGRWSYTHDGSENFADAFTYAVTDAAGASSQATVSLAVTPVNDSAPVAQGTTVTLAEGGTASGSLSFSDADLPDDRLAVTLVSGPAHGLLVLGADGAWRYTHDGGEAPSDAFTYAVTDAAGATSQATVTLHVTPVDDATVARGDQVSVDEDGEATGNLLANDSDPDSALVLAGFQLAGDDTWHAPGETLRLDGVGTLSVQADGSFRFTPAADWNGVLPAVRYTTDSGATATLHITVQAVNDAPVREAEVSPIDVAEGGSASLGLGSVGYGVGGGADEAASQAIVVTVTGLPAGLGTITLADGSPVAAGGSYTLAQLGGMRFQAAAGVGTGTASFAFDVSDNAAGAQVLAQSLAITVSNRAPVLEGVNGMRSLAEDATDNEGMLVADLVAGRAHDAGGRVGIAVTAAAADGGQWQFTRDGGGSWSSLAGASAASAELLAGDALTRIRFVPVADWNGTASGLSLRAWDGSGGTAGATRADTTVSGGGSPFSAATASVHVVVDAVNDAPRPVAGLAPAELVVNETTGAVVMGNGWDYVPGAGNESGQRLTVVLTAVPPPALGTLQLADGVTSVETGRAYALDDLRGLRFVAAAAAAGQSAELSWVVRDDAGTANGGADSHTGAVRITVARAPAPAPAAEAPVARPPAEPVSAPLPATAPVPALAALAAPQPIAATGPRPATGTVGDALVDAGPAAVQVTGDMVFAAGRRQETLSDPARGTGATARTASELLLVGFHPQVAFTDFEVRGLGGFDGSGTRFTVEQFHQSLRSGAFVEELNRLRDQLREEFDLDKTLNISVAGLSLGVSVAYVLWLVRGGVLVGSYLSALPAWRLLDPLPVLARAGEAEDDDEDDAFAEPEKGPDPLRGFS